MPTIITSALVAGFFALSGTNAVSAPEAPEINELPTYTVAMTSYNAVPAQTDSDPWTTASGLRSNPEIIVARSQDLADELPFGTVIAVTRAAEDTHNCGFSKVEDRIGYRVVGDAMNARMRNKIDLLLDHNDTLTVGGVARNPSRVLGYCDQVNVQVIGFMDLKEVPTTQTELITMVEQSRIASAR
ncbi:MAG: hypothetical protein KBC38_03775 [Candidatus Pacebacteria bacterium]|nr:hypothetical protein [Candidatus Paceibacterota bacterium]MBP9840546.1 hypothetical protein [Candidatus Paceibacterota bacterium]